MLITGVGSIDRSEKVVDQPGLTNEGAASAHARAASGPSHDQIAITDFARINLLTPPPTSARLSELQQLITSGEYGPPAMSIAEGLISMAIARGLKIQSV
jgi:hypothetical protein